MGQLHLKNCLLIKNVDIAVSDISKLALAKAKKQGVKEVYVDYRELLEKGKVDAVLITLPNHLHKESAILSAERGIDIFIEKPLARSAEECKEIIHVAKKNHVKLMVGYYQRFLDRNQVLKSIINDGTLGDVTLIVYQFFGGGPFSHRFPPSHVPEWWFSDKMVGGGVLLDTGCHMIDLVRWLLDDDFSVQSVSLSYEFRLPIEDTAIITLQSIHKGALASLSASWLGTQHQRSFQRIDVHGYARSISSDELAFDNKLRRILSEVLKNAIKRLVGREIEPYSLSESARAYYRELRHFIECVCEDKTPLITGEDGLECAKIIDEAYKYRQNADISKNNLR